MKTFFGLITVAIFATNATMSLHPSSDLRLDELDDFNLLSILESMDFVSLINLAYTSERFHYLVERHVMLPKFRIHEREICMKRIGSTNVGANTITLTHEIPILRFLRSFGKDITHIKLEKYDFSMKQMHQIIQYIAKYSSKSLQKIQLLNISSYSLRDINQNFPNAIDVQLNFDSWENPKISEIFPSMQRLKIDSAFLLVLSHGSGESSIPKNLKGLEINGYPLAIAVSYVSKILPNLEELKFWYDPMLIRPMEIFEFKCVKKLTIMIQWNSDISTPPPFQFEQLEWLEIEIKRLNNVAINIIRQSRSIKTLNLSKVQEIDDGMQRVFDIVSEFPHFNEIVLSWSGIVSATEYMSQINQSASRLHQITIFTEYEEYRNLLIAAIPYQWHLERTWQENNYEDNKYFLTITRKNE